MSNEKPYMNFSPGESLVPAEASSEYLEAFYQRRGEMEGCEIPMPFDEDTFLIGVDVAGTSYRENMPQLFPTLKLGEPVTLLREPDIAYDPRAILILTKAGEPLGYVPRDYNLILSRLMDAGFYLYGKLRLLEQPTSTYYHIVVKIYLKSI